MLALPLIALFALHGSGSKPPEPDFAKTWATVESSIESRFYARKTRKAEMDKLLAKYAPAAKASQSKSEFSKVVNEMIHDFGDSHFAFYTPDDQGFYSMDGLANSTPAKMPNIGAWFRPKGNGYEVQMLLEESAASKADLRKGDVVTSADGRPFAPVGSFRGKEDKPVELTVQRGGETMKKTVTVEAEPCMEMFLSATRRSEKVMESHGKKIGYIHLWTMASDGFKNELSNTVYGKFKDTDAIILDIRDGFGGRPEGYGDPFFRPRTHIDWDFGAGVQHQLFGYDKPMILLINEGSRSAKEVFSLIIKKSKRAILIGSNTAGHVLGTSPAKLEDWAYLEIPMVDVVADGVRLEKVGVAPDIEVKPEYDANGSDLVIKKALEVLAQGGARKAA